jgi:hypothetical protein
MTKRTQAITLRHSACALLRAALIALFLSATPEAPQATPMLSVGVGRLAFHDPRLQETYAAPLFIDVSIAGPRIGPLHPALELGVAWDEKSPASMALVEGARTHLLFCPILLRIPFVWQPGPRLALRLGPEGGVACYREEWHARIPTAGIESKRHGTGAWLSAGIGAEVSVRIGRAGAIGLAADWLWAEGERTTVGANPMQEESLEAGWRAARITWTLPWPAQP